MSNNFNPKVNPQQAVEEQARAAWFANVIARLTPPTECDYKDRLISVLCNALAGHVEQPHWDAEQWLAWAEGMVNE